MTEQERMSAAAFRELVNAQQPAGPAKDYGHAVRCEEDGIKFASKLERDRYLWLKDQPEVKWIDVHPALSLPGGIRFTADFMVHTDDGIRIEDTKGRRPGTDFMRLWKMFNYYHALSPLIVVKRAGKGWQTFSEPPKRKEW